MKHFLSLILSLLFAPTMLWAEDISVQQALQIAKTFSASPQWAAAKADGLSKQTEPQLAHSIKSAKTGKDNVYVVNLGQGQGFVVVSGDDGADSEVLGYCDHGDFDFSKAPVQLQALLTSYSSQVDSLRQKPVEHVQRAKAFMGLNTANSVIGTMTVGPLLKTEWDQWGPYNDLCPKGCPTGCYPTAIAQVMRYWKWPNVTQGTVGDEDFSGRTYDWDNMLDHYSSGGYDHTQAVAVATLMADIGKAFRTTYDPSGSPTSFWFEPLAENFNYDRNMEKVRAEEASALASVMARELDKRQPVLYCGASWYSSHALVVDGYTSENYFHFNYGWGGYCDGYYKNAVCADFYMDAWIIKGIRPSEAIHIEQDGVKYDLLPDGTAEIVGHSLYGKENMELTLPNTVKDDEGKEYKVVRITKGAFAGGCNFKKLVMGDYIKEIAPYCFIYGYINELVLSDEMEVVPDYAFRLTDIETLTIGAKVKHIGDYAFGMCPLYDVICKSPGFTAGKRAFEYSKPSGEWLGRIKELGKEAFVASEFKGIPEFTNLERIGKDCFSAARMPDVYRLNLGDKVRYIDPTAFANSKIIALVGDNNPYLTNVYNQAICNKNNTSVVMLTNLLNVLDWPDSFPETVTKFEPGSINRRVSGCIFLNRNVEDVTNAFSNCPGIGGVICQAVVPPVATDSTFNEALFEQQHFTLHVPVGTEEIYENAPGWRRFKEIRGDQPYVPATVTPEREYYMVLHCSADGKKMKKRLPVTQVKDIRVGDYIDGEGQTMVINGMDETQAYRVDSITWMRGFAYGQAEVFDISPENLVAKATDCTVRLDPTVVDGDVQLSIRRLTSASKISEGMEREIALDISLSDGSHELTGTAEITIPYPLGEDERLKAGYYNEESGEWEPVFCRYDEQKQAAVILTDHLSLFNIYVDKVGTKMENLLPGATYLDCYWPYHENINEAITKLYDALTSDDPDSKMLQEWKENYSFYQTIGLDGGYNLLGATGLMPEAVDNAVGIVGWLGTALTILDVAAADIKGDDVQVAGNTLKAIQSVSATYVGSVVGGAMLSVASAATAFIGIALEKLGTTVQKAKKDYARGVYRLYYSQKGEEITGKNSFYTTQEWYKLLYPAFEKGRPYDKLMLYVEQVVRRYCDKFWEEDNDTYSLLMGEYREISKPFGFTSFHNFSQSDMEEISYEYFTELIHGSMVSVIQAIKNKVATDSKRRYDKYLKDYVDMMNTEVGFKFQDSSCPEGEVSKYNGWTVRFSEMPSEVTDLSKWECTLSDQGEATLGYFTLYALLKNKVKPQLTLVNLDGDEVASFDYKFGTNSWRTIIGIDLAKDGHAVEAGNSLEMTYEPDSVMLRAGLNYHYTFRGEKIEDDSKDMFYVLIQYATDKVGGLTKDNTPLYDVNLKKVHFQKEVENYFDNLKDVRFEFGKVMIGDEIVGDWSESEHKGSGKFTINTAYTFEERTVDEFVSNFNALFGETIESTNLLLNGKMNHKIDCEFEIVPLKDGSGYKFSVTGLGDYELDAVTVKILKGLDFDTIKHETEWSLDFDYFNMKIKAENVETGRSSDKGSVKLSFSKNFIIQ